MAHPKRSDSKSEINSEDCRKILSVLNHEEKMRSKKRRWLMQSQESNKKLHKKRNASLSGRMPKFLPETLPRSKNETAAVKNYLRTRLGLSDQHEWRHHVVKDFLNLFDMFKADPVMFHRNLSSAVHRMKSYVIENIITVVLGKNLGSERTREAMVKIIEEDIPEILLQVDSKNTREKIEQLSLIFRNPGNFQDDHLNIMTPVTAELFTSIRQNLELLDEMPPEALLAIERKLDGVVIVPHLFADSSNCRRGDICTRLKRRFDDLFPKLVVGTELPESVAKALSVISLYKKQMSGQDDMLTVDFFPFKPEALDLQDNILKAIWSLEKIRPTELLKLLRTIYPNANLLQKHRKAPIRRFLVEYLYECEDTDVPRSFLRFLSVINRESKRQLDFCRKRAQEEELEAVLNISGQLRQIVWESFSDQVVVPDEDGVESDCDDIDDNIIIDDLGEFCTSHIQETYLDAQVEGMGDSEPQDPAVFICKPSHSSVDINYLKTDRTKKEQNIDLNSTQLYPTLSAESPSGLTLHNKFDSSKKGYADTYNICKETSLLACGLIDHVMEKIQDSTKNGNLSSMASLFLIQAVEELVPSCTNSDIAHLKRLVVLP